MKSLQELCDHGMAFATAYLKERGNLAQMFALYPASGAPTILLTPWADQEEKDRTLYQLKDEMKQHGTVAYVHMGEAWMADVQVNPGLLDIPVRKREDRIEVITVDACDETDAVCAMAEIVRDETGKITGTKPIPSLAGARYAGRMVELLR